MIQKFHTKEGAATLSILSNATLIIVKLSVGILTGSISVLGDALDSVVDLIASLVALSSIRIAAKPADLEHPFGHGKVENISGVVEGGLILVGAAFITWQAIKRMIEGAVLQDLDWGLGAMAFSLVLNTVLSLHIFRVARRTDSVALEADAQHVATNAYQAVGVLVGLLAVRLTGLQVFDSLVAIGIAGLLVWTSYNVHRQAIAGLIDTRLPKEEEEVIRASIMEHYGEMMGFHELRSRKAGSLREINLHLVMSKNASIEEAHRLCDHLEDDIRRKLPGSIVTIHIEPCDGDCDDCDTPCPEKDGRVA